MISNSVKKELDMIKLIIKKQKQLGYNVSYNDVILSLIKQLEIKLEFPVAKKLLVGYRVKPAIAYRLKSNSQILTKRQKSITFNINS